MLDALAELVPAVLGRPVPRAELRRAVIAGAVKVNGVPCRRPGDVVPGTSARLEIALRVAFARSSSEGDEPAPRLDESAILFEDEWLIALAKPPGLLSHESADRTRPHLFGLVRELLSRRSRGSGGEPYLGSHQRLDKDTSGVVLFAKDPAANDGLSRAFEGRDVEKIYLALTARPRGKPLPAWTSDQPLALVGNGRQARMRTVRQGGQPALTGFRLIQDLGEALLVEARPHTGRKHQVRAHLAESGLPVLGDLRYGGSATAFGQKLTRVMLHASSLRLPHPLTGLELSIRCPLPADFEALLRHSSQAPRQDASSRGPGSAR